MRESVLLFVCYFLLVSMGPGDLLQPSLFSCVLSSLEHPAHFSYLLQTLPYLACSHTSLLISSFHPYCEPTRAFLRACTPQRACLQPALKTFPQEMNELSESLLASRVQPMQTSCLLDVGNVDREDQFLCSTLQKC